MTQRKTPPFRADHVGSLLRPQELHDARDKARAGKMSAAELKAVQDKHIRDVVAKVDGHWKIRSKAIMGWAGEVLSRFESRS